MATLTFDDVKKLVADNNQCDTIFDRLFICLIWKESGFNPDVKNAASSATGLMQLTKGAVTEVNRVKKTSFDHDAMTNPSLNIQCGTSYVDILKKRANGNLTTALNRYGTGKGYATSIIACSQCMGKDADHPMICLHKIHK